MRLELTRKTDLALQALQRLVGGGGRHKGGALADALGTTAGFLAQVLTPLARAGWVRSVPGPHGGYEATAAARDVSVLELIEAIEGPVRDDACVLRPQPCPAEVPCALHDAWVPARDALVSTLGATTVMAHARGRPVER